MRDVSGQVLELRRAGLPFVTIAQKLGIGSAREAQGIYLEALELASAVEMSPAQAVLAELDRVERLHAGVWAKASKGDVSAIQQALRLSDRRRFLYQELAAQTARLPRDSAVSEVEWGCKDPRDAPTSGGMTDCDGVDMSKATSHVRPVRKSRSRLSKVANARDTIEGFGHDMDIAGLTYGQFSLIDLIDAALEVTGPADVVISTWSAGFYDADAALRFRDSGRIRSIRFVMDSSAKRGQARVTDVEEIFGPGTVRATRSHAKFALITNADWNVVVTSSMNLNLNPRLEQFEMTDDAGRCGMFMEFVDAVFAELPEGDTGDRMLPGLRDLDGVEPSLGIEVNRHIRVGRWAN